MRLCNEALLARVVRWSNCRLQPQYTVQLLSTLLTIAISGKEQEPLYSCADQGMRNSIPIIAQAVVHGDRPALQDETGNHTYADVLHGAQAVASRLLGGRLDLEGACVAFMAPPGLPYLTALWGIWLSGGMAVPLCRSHPIPEIARVFADSEPTHLLVHPAMEQRLTGVALQHNLYVVRINRAMQTATQDLPVIAPERSAMILYTSGTTSRPKGVVTTHNNITAMVTPLVETWGVCADDILLHVLPLHHTHGIIAALLTPLWAGAKIVCLAGFDAREVWRQMAGSTLLMAVPTMYARLLQVWEEGSVSEKEQWAAGVRRMRLMISGSAALPVSIFDRWREITGHRILERYGMTEIGLVLSNPLEGDRRPGFVGCPVPNVSVRLVDDAGSLIATDGVPGELHVSGANVFREYWNRPADTRASFEGDWFRTGDIAARDQGYYRILGRMSVDIVKTGGYKVSALEVEEVLRLHPAIAACAVVGLEDAEWGERVAAAVVLNSGTTLSLRDLRSWAKKRLASYKAPTRLECFEALPRNVMGKIKKPAVRDWLRNRAADPTHSPH